MTASKFIGIVLSILFVSGCTRESKVPLEIHDNVSELLEKFAPVEITADISFLPANEKQALARLIEASQYMDEIFLRQVWEKNPDYRQALAARKDELGKKAYAYFNISYGIWDRLDEHDAPFINDIEKPAGAGYYPLDLDKAQFEAYLQAHPEQAETLTGLFTVVRRQGGTLAAIDYSLAYREWLDPAAKLLREAADLTEKESLKRFLTLRAEAFYSNEYRESDMAWMDLDSPVEITIGPYEVYEDKLFGYKAAFESFVTVTDPEESKKLARFKAELPAMERNLPIPENMKNLNRGSESPIRVVDEVFTAGDTRAGVQTIAYNLPNDEVVREQKGSKKVLLRNVITAKYEKILEPIAERLISNDQLQFLSADAFTTQVLFHELAHGLGPGKISINGRQTEVRLEIKELYAGLEEAKADIMGLYNIFYMSDKGLLAAEMRKQFAVTFVAGLFRSMRFGIGDAHGKGNALQFNYLLEKGAITQDEATGTFAVNFDSFENWVRELVQDICILQATGDYDGTKALFEKYVKLPDALAEGATILQGIPVDIVPKYPVAEQLAQGTN
ncbi:MAG: peptidase [bacterium]